MEGLHDEIGDWDFSKTYKIISDKFWCPKMRPDISQFVRNCDPCQNTNTAKQSTPYGKIPVSVLFYTWSIDFSGVEYLSCPQVACAIGAELLNRTGVVGSTQPNSRFKLRNGASEK